MRTRFGFVLAFVCGFAFAACGVEEQTNAPECRLNSDCVDGKVCQSGHCVARVAMNPGSDAGATYSDAASAKPGSWVARAGGANELQLATAHVSSANCAGLVGWQPPLQGSDKGPAAVRVGEADGYYSFDLRAQNFGAGRYRVTYRGGDSCQAGQMTNLTNWRWAQFGDGHFHALNDGAKTWLCQYKNEGGQCVTDVFLDYDSAKSTVSAAGLDECAKRPHWADCPNLHR